MRSRISPRPSRRALLTGLLALPALSPRLRAASPAPGFADRARGLDQLHGLVVSTDGTVTFAEAFRGPALERAVNVKSVSKTLVASLVGPALERGVIDSVDTPVTRWLPAPAGADPRVSEVTLAHLLSMRAGLERTSGPNYGGWIASGNWVANALACPFEAEPGGRMLYSTGSTHLVGAALSEASGESLLALMRDWLGRPLGIDIPPWTRDPQGYYLGGNNMALSPMGLMRFAEMVRNGGLHEGRRVLPREWIEASWQPRTVSPFSGDAYGYGWFLRDTAAGRMAYGRGYGGQLVCVVPERRTSIVVTSDPTQPARSAGYFGALMDLVTEDILPSV
ncbi:serine hydrolase [Oceanicella sp. SM1341]|uniref:serine hydrolase domain-containing protein n=1 Tax=Oceanicella sp. SM1341 TaxID=1548889 RepID=UPI000E478601|nr:serine hydrolase [Oceanicella sp. SM1341]